MEVARDPLYGFDGDARMPPADEQQYDPLAPADEDVRMTGVGEAEEDELEEIRERLIGFDLDRDDGNWGINVYLGALDFLGV